MISDKDIVELSCEHSYKQMKIQDKLSVNGNDYQVIGLYNETNGYEIGLDAFLVANEQGENALIFVGSDKSRDLVNDWGINNGANLIGVTPPQYQLGLDLVNDLEKSGVAISKIGGVSLGGGIASYVGMHNNNSQVVAINPSPQAYQVEDKFNNINVIIDTNDILYNSAVIASREQNYPGNIHFFNRGNEFSQFTLNHRGYSNNSNLTLDEQFPFDLLTNNLNSDVDVSKIDIAVVNTNFNSSTKNYQYEYETCVDSNLKQLDKMSSEEFKLASVYENIFSTIGQKLNSELPTLSTSFDFENYFTELSTLLNYSSSYILDSLLTELKQKLDVNHITSKIFEDSLLVQNNANNIFSHFDSLVSSVDTILNNYENADNNILVFQKIFIHNSEIKSGRYTNNISYFGLIGYAKSIYHNLINLIVKTYLYDVEMQIDKIIWVIKNLIGKVGSVVGFFSSDVKLKTEYYELILNELYMLDCCEIVSISINLFIDEILNIIVPSNIDSYIKYFKYNSGIVGNIEIVFSQYIEYLNSVQSKVIGKLSLAEFEEKTKLTQYNNYLLNTYI